MDENLYLTRWCKKFVKSGVMALYNSLTLRLLYLPQNDGELLFSKVLLNNSRKTLELQFGLNTINLLVREGFLVNNPEKDELLLKSVQSMTNSIRLDFCYLLLTDDCNLKCRYCFEDSPLAPTFSPVQMDVQTVTAALDAFARLTGKYGGDSNSQRVIHLYGGEPLLNVRGVKTAVKKTKELISQGKLPKKSELVIITNGTLLTEELSKFFCENDVTIGISLDGPKEINDVNRISKINKQGTFDKIVHAYQIARDSGAKLGLSATLTPEVVSNFDEVLRFFVDDLGIEDGISFNIMHFNPSFPGSEAYYNLAAQCLIKAFDVFRDRNIYEERMMRKAQALIECDPIITDCGVNGGQIVISPDGSFGVCQDFVKPRTYFSGTVHDLNYDPVTSGQFDEWRNRSPVNMPACVDCVAVGICGGGCPASAELMTGSRWNVDKRICPHSKLTLEWLVWEAYLQK